jgi:hypothetical protein
MYAQVLLVEAISVVVVAPALGVAIRSLRVRIAALSILIGLSMMSLWITGGLPATAFHAVTAAHATIGAAALALASIGALCRAACDDPLDAVGLTAIIGTVGGFGVFLLGDFAALLSTPVLNSALAANPIVATASAVNIDIFRSVPLYQFSPIAHREFQYPAWQSAAVLYSCVAIVASLAAARAQSTRHRGFTAST